MQDFLNFKCFCCGRNLQGFVMLSCNHSLCEQCICTYKTISSSYTAITCKCGLTTYTQNNTTSNTKCSQINISSPKNLSNSYNNNPQSAMLLSFSNLTSDNTDIQRNNKTVEDYDIRTQTEINKYLNTEVKNQIKSLESKFMRCLNQINRNYIQTVDLYKRKFAQFTHNITKKCSILILQANNLNISSLSAKINQNFKKKVQIKLNKFNASILHFEKQLKKQILPTIQRQNKLSQANCSQTTIKKSKDRTGSQKKRRCSGEVGILSTKNKKNFEQLRHDIREQKKLLKKTMLIKKPSQLFQL